MIERIIAYGRLKILPKDKNMMMRIAPIYVFSAFYLLAAANLLANEANTVVAIMNVGVNPASIAVTPNNHWAYVPNNNNYGITGGYTVTVLNLRTNTVEKTIRDSSFDEPYRVAITPDGKKAYVANSNSTTISIIDTSINEVVGVIDGFDGPSGIVITPEGDRAYVNNYGGPDGVGSGNGNTLRVVDLINNVIVGPPIIVGLAPAALAISPKGKFVYVANYVDGNPGTGTMSIINTSTNTVIRTVTGFSGPFALAVTPNGNYAYVTNFGSNNFDPIGTTVSVVDLKAGFIVDTIDVGIQPSGIAITPDGCFVYVTNYNTLYAGPNFTKLTAGEGTVNIIDTEYNEVIPPTIEVGLSPSNITISPNGQYAYVTNYTSNIVSVIELCNNQMNL